MPSIGREDLEARLAMLRRQEAAAEARIQTAREELSMLKVAIEESEFWLFEVAKREAKASIEAA